MTKEEAMSCLVYGDGDMDHLSAPDEAHMGLFAEWQTGNNPLYTNSPLGRDPPVPSVARSGLPQKRSAMSITGRDPAPEEVGVATSGDECACSGPYGWNEGVGGAASYGFGLLGLMGLYALVRGS